jgi:alkylmercury lyase
MPTINPGSLASELAAATPALSEDEQRLFITLYRLLAAGQPVETAKLADHAGLPVEVVNEALERLRGVYRDDERRVIGFWGLSIRPMPHRITINGRTLYAWCAWDTLFLPELLDAPAEIESRCPITGQRIALTVAGTEVTTHDPVGIVLTFLHRDEPFDGDTIRTFCYYVHFFASPEAATEWTNQHEGTFTLSLTDGSALARLTNRARYPSIFGD